MTVFLRQDLIFNDKNYNSVEFTCFIYLFYFLFLNFLDRLYLSLSCLSMEPV